jgi:hypothetical protein
MDLVDPAFGEDLPNDQIMVDARSEALERNSVQMEASPVRDGDSIHSKSRKRVSTWPTIDLVHG